MRKLLLLIAIVVVCAPAGFAQDYSNWEFFIGYAHERAINGGDRLDARGLAINPNGTTSTVDFTNKRVPHHGVTGEVVANVHRNVGLVTNFSATFANTEFVDRFSGRTFDARLSRYTLLFGPRYNFRNSSAAIPYVHALFGLARYKADFKDDDFTCPDTNETAFAMALGAGLDIKASDRIDIRPIQVDYLPVFFDNRREDGVRFSAGVKIKN
ncbi:MAG TPA: outer membrane beta-barrel protein [Pyrinomonadaceae bacterium]|nr:outer membrane beta-barrel protein [Pyrinomonadaceae bacterium]